MVQVPYRNHWPVWLGASLLGFAIVMQIISFFAKWVPGIKRHQFWIHPIFANAVIYAALVSLAILATPVASHPTIYSVAAIAALFLILWRKPRFQEWFAGPQ